MGAPALIDLQGEAILTRINELSALLGTNCRGGAITDGGTTQASGANAAFNLDLDVAIVEGMVANVPVYKAAGVDIDATGGADLLWTATSGKDVSCAVVLHLGADGATAVAYDTVLGAVADTGESVAPTEDEIDEALGHSYWVLVGDVVFSRTADTTVTVTPDYSRRASLGSKVTEGTPAANRTGTLSTTEAEWREAAE